jgi:competence protein ComGC
MFSDLKNKASFKLVEALIILVLIAIFIGLVVFEAKIM